MSRPHRVRGCDTSCPNTVIPKYLRGHHFFFTRSFIYLKPCCRGWLLVVSLLLFPLPLALVFIILRLFCRCLKYFPLDQLFGSLSSFPSLPFFSYFTILFFLCYDVLSVLFCFHFTPFVLSLFLHSTPCVEFPSANTSILSTLSTSTIWRMTTARSLEHRPICDNLSIKNRKACGW